MEEKQILIICGEASGDLHAADLAEKILEINPAVKISAVGGPLLRKAGAQIYCDIKDLAVMGFFDALKKLPQFFALQKFLLERLKEEKPDLIILVDFSGFNLRFARAVNRTIPVIYYVSPQVWASRPGRLDTIKKYINKMIVLFKFEEDFYRRNGMDADFVGHPLLDIVKPAAQKKEFLNNLSFDASKPVIALLPGSRRQEVKHILPVMLKASLLILKSIPGAQFVLAKSPQVSWEAYHSITRAFSNIEVKIIEGKTYDCLNIADFCLVASGTATLETAIMQKPFAVIYKMGLLNYLLYRPQVRIPYIGMANIVAGKKIVPEFIQFRARPQQIAETVVRLLENPSALERIKTELAQIRPLLGEKGASLRAATIVLDFLKNN
jgi:lipid-A-disaccharide synthase